MPLYDLQCTRCQTVKKDCLFQRYQETLQPIFCDMCSKVTEWETLPPLTVMKPDKYWSGVITPTGDIVYSDTEYNDVMKNVVPATRENKEFVQKQTIKRKQEHEEKKEQRRNKFFDKLANEL